MFLFVFHITGRSCQLQQSIPIQMGFQMGGKAVKDVFDIGVKGHTAVVSCTQT